jgi:hypothetical protein
MGFHSKCCVKSNLPIVVEAKGYPLLNEVVALLPDGVVAEGSYDGYGRVGGVDLLETETGEWQWPKVKMVLKTHYAGEKYDDLPEPQTEMGQGYFMANEFLDYCLTHGPFKTRAQYVRAFGKYANW